MNVKPCPICEANSSRLWWRANLPEQISVKEFSYSGDKKFHGQVVRCPKCTHRYVSPIPTATESMYSEVTDDFYLESESYRKDTFADFLGETERLTKISSGRCLDVGCSAGLFLDVAKAKGYSTFGIELSRWAVELARSKGHVVYNQSLFDHRVDEKDKYDLVTAFDIVEHLEDPRSALKQLKSLLRPGGALVGIVPDMDAWHMRLLGQHHWLVVLMHYQYFSRQSLRLLLKDVFQDKWKLVLAPAYRFQLKKAAHYSKSSLLLQVPLSILRRLPFVRNSEIRLKAGLMFVGWN